MNEIFKERLRKIKPLRIFAITTLLFVGASESQQTQAQTETDTFLEVCGLEVCLDGNVFQIHSATTYGQLNNPQAEIDLALQAGLNTLEIVEYENEWRNLATSLSDATWKPIDQMIKLASENNLHIILNLSSYGHSLKQDGQKPTSVDWREFLEFVSKRENTISGQKYNEDGTIAMILLYGEADAPNYGHEPLRGTADELREFYSRTLGQAQELFPHHIISSGGLSYLDDPNSGVPWQDIMADPNNEVCSIEINSVGDRDSTVPQVTQYCFEAGKPWFLAAFSGCLRPEGPQFDGDLNSWLTDAAIAAHFEEMYEIASQEPYPAVGASFWNLGNETGETCDINQQNVPQTFAVVQNAAPSVGK